MSLIAAAAVCFLSVAVIAIDLNYSPFIRVIIIFAEYEFICVLCFCDQTDIPMD